jgi:nucleoside-diphosphate-sugar epimerase
MEDKGGNTTRRVLIVGCGFVGEAAADLFHARGWEVTAWTGSGESARQLAGAKPYAVAAQDITDAEDLKRAGERLGTFDALADCVSSKGGGAEQYRKIYLEGARNLLAAVQTGRFLFTGSTSVYVQTDGAWVDETSPAQPERETGRLLRETEDLVLAHGGSVARLAGLYGPGRSVLLRKFLDGEAVLEGDGSRWMNFCHRDDAAAALFTLAEAAHPPGLCNAADDHPMTQLECYRSLSELFGRPLPPSGPIDLGRKRGWTSKRVRNALLRSAGWQPKFPSFLDWAKTSLVVEDANH